MPQANLDLVRRLYAAWGRDGFGVVEELMDPEIEWVNPPYAVEPGIRRGYAEFAAAARASLDIYGESSVTAVSPHEVGDRVAVVARVATTSRANAVPIEADRGFVFDVRDGRVARFAWFVDPSEALAEVGLDTETARTPRSPDAL